MLHQLFLTTSQATKIRNAVAKNMLRNIKFSKAPLPKEKAATKVGKGSARAGKGFTLFVHIEDMNDIIKIIKPLEDSNVLIDGITEKRKHKKKKRKKKQEGGFLPALLAPLATSLVQPVISLVVKRISRRGIRRARRLYINNSF